MLFLSTMTDLRSRFPCMGMALLGGLTMLLVATSTAFAQTAASLSDNEAAAGDAADSQAEETPPRPALQLLRHKEDWSSLQDPAQRTEFFDPLKYIPIGGAAYLTLGADVRLRYEYFTGEAFAYGRPDDPYGFLVQRYMAHGDLHSGWRVRLFGQLKSNLVTGQSGPPRPIDENMLDVHQLFAEVDLLRAEHARVALQAGRQEVNYGRLVSFREGPNVRLSFDALRLKGHTHKWHFEGLLARPVEISPDMFGDPWMAPGETLWSARLGRPDVRVLGDRSPGLALYYLGLHREKSTTVEPLGSEMRHTVGLELGTLPLRTSGINLEGAVQWVSTGEGDGIAPAWFLAAEGTRVFSDAPLQPRMGLIAQAISGDPDPHDPGSQAFIVPHPNNGALGFALSSPAGAGNIYHVRPALALHLLDDLAFSGAWGAYWRQSTADAVYGLNGEPFLVAPEAHERFIGHLSQLAIDLQLGPYVNTRVLYEHFFGSPFFEAAERGTRAGFVALQTTLRF